MGMAERALLLDTINPAATEVFGGAGLEVVEFDKGIKPEVFASVIQDVSLLGIRSGPNVPASVMESTDSLEAIGCFSVGVNVEGETANKRGVAIFNSVHENTRSVAEYVIGSVFGLLRRIPEHNSELHDGNWTKTDKDSFEVRGKKLGIIGYGAIGSQVSGLAETIGMDVVYYDPAPQIPPQGRAKRLDTLDAVLSTADVVTLHVPGGARNGHMIDADKIALMKQGSYLINAARGELIDYEAVAEAINSGQLNGIAADVFEDEPAKAAEDVFDHRLRDLGRAILTPHIAGSTIEAQTDIGDKTARKLLSYLKTGNSSGSVNLPPLPLGGMAPGTSRLLNIHDNQSGAMAASDALLAEAGLNIVGIQHKAKDEIGYAAQDIEGDIPMAVLEAIRDLDTTRRARVIY